MNETRDFFQLCKNIGARTPDWVQGAGGNISQKVASSGRSLLRIKASGYRLDQVSDSQGFVDLSYADTAKKLGELAQAENSEERYAELLATSVVARAKTTDRPSMETGFHLAIEAPFVAHFHSLVALLLADLYFKKDRRTLEFVNTIDALDCRFLDYVKPGLDLSLAIQSSGQAEAYFLKNHGLILALGRERDLDRWVQLEQQIIEVFGWEKLQTDRGAEAQDYWPIAALMPDTVVFMDRLYAVLEENLQRPGTYRLGSGPIDPSLRELWVANIRLLSTMPDVAPIPLTEWEAISGMPVEKHRQSMQSSPKRL